jgi:Na+-driven multidrug efflux pump
MNAPPRGVTRPIPGELVRLALPMLASLTLRVAYQWIDALWVRALGVEATAAVTTSIFIMWAVYSLNDVFAIGVTAYVSQLLGAGERQRAGVAAWKGVRSSALVGLIATAAGLLFARDIYALMDPNPRMVAAGASFLRICLIGSPLFMVALTCESIMRSAGDTRTPLLIDLASVGTCAILDPLLIYGIGPFPRLGVTGAGIATVSAWALMVIGYLVCAASAWRGWDCPRLRSACCSRACTWCSRTRRRASVPRRTRWWASRTGSRPCSSSAPARSAAPPPRWWDRTSGPGVRSARSRRSAPVSPGSSGSRRRSRP